MQEGEPGDAMYVIKSGKLEVYVGGSLTRHVGRGCAVGELALLYHTPRSASVKVSNLSRPGRTTARRGWMPGLARSWEPYGSLSFVFPSVFVNQPQHISPVPPPSS